MSNNKQSSIELLFHKLWDTPKDKFTWYAILEEHKAMYKDEIEKVSEDWWNEGASYMYDGQRKYNSFEQYYNETFGGNNGKAMDN